MSFELFSYDTLVLCSMSRLHFIWQKQSAEQTSPHTAAAVFPVIILHTYTKLTVARHPTVSEAQFKMVTILLERLLSTPLSRLWIIRLFLKFPADWLYDDMLETVSHPLNACEWISNRYILWLTELACLRCITICVSFFLVTMADSIYFVYYCLYKHYHTLYLMVTSRTFPDGTSFFEGTFFFSSTKNTVPPCFSSLLSDESSPCIEFDFLWWIVLCGNCHTKWKLQHRSQSWLSTIINMRHKFN